MRHPWRIRLKQYFARLLFRFGKLKHVAFTERELNDLLVDLFPLSFAIDVPRGDGKLNIESGKLRLSDRQNQAELELLCDLNISMIGNPLYRAHIIAKVHLVPKYLADQRQVAVGDAKLAHLYLQRDEYAVLTDTSSLINKLFPGSQLTGLLAGTVSSALHLMSAGTSEQLLSYLQLYLSGSKQRILDHHRPQIQTLLEAFAAGDEVKYNLDPSDWEEDLFMQCGKSVVVEDRELRFKF